MKLIYQNPYLFHHRSLIGVDLWLLCFRTIIGLVRPLHHFGLFSDKFEQEHELWFTRKSNTIPFLSKFPDLLYIVILLSEVREHVPIIAIHVSTEDLNVPGGTQLVYSNHEVSGAPGQTNLNQITDINAL